MTPKEKATELYDMFYKVNYIDDYDYLTGHNSKESAKIAVDEIIDVIINMFGDNTGDYNYWQKVKQELEKL